MSIVSSRVTFLVEDINTAAGGESACIKMVMYTAALQDS